MSVHDAYASIYRINMLIFKISQLNYADFLGSMQYMKSQQLNVREFESEMQ